MNTCLIHVLVFYYFKEHFEQKLDTIPETALNPMHVRAMKILQGFYSEDDSKVVEQVKQEKAISEGSIF